MKARHIGPITNLFSVIRLLEGAQNKRKFIRLALNQSEVPGRVLCRKEFTECMLHSDLSLLCVVVVDLLANLGDTDNQQENE